MGKKRKRAAQANELPTKIPKNEDDEVTAVVSDEDNEPTAGGDASEKWLLLEEENPGAGGPKFNDPDGSVQQSQRIQAELRDRIATLLFTKGSRPPQMSQALWDGHSNLVLLNRGRGPHHQSLGFTGPTGWRYLYAEEALYLLDRGCLEIVYTPQIKESLNPSIVGLSPMVPGQEKPYEEKPAVAPISATEESSGSTSINTERSADPQQRSENTKPRATSHSPTAAVCRSSTIVSTANDTCDAAAASSTATDGNASNRGGVSKSGSTTGAERSKRVPPGIGFRRRILSESEARARFLNTERHIPGQRQAHDTAREYGNSEEGVRAGIRAAGADEAAKARWTMLLDQRLPTFAEYQTYKHLKRIGFYIRRAPQRELTPLRQLQDRSSSRGSIDDGDVTNDNEWRQRNVFQGLCFSIWPVGTKGSTPFRRGSGTLPVAKVWTSIYEESPDWTEMLQKLSSVEYLKTSEEGQAVGPQGPVPMLMAVVNAGSVAFYNVSNFISPNYRNI
eukprot:Clim_evm16s216 gene=Clim_evmTU16s216